MPMPEEPDPSRTVFSLPRTWPAPTHGGRLAVLIVLRGREVGRRYLLNEGSLVIGRRPERADLVIADDPRISSVHCRIERSPVDDAWTLVDLASTNGTFVSGHKITKVTLRDGDRIQLGETVLKFCYHDELEQEFHRQVDHLMNNDELTGLPVQRLYQQLLQEALRSAARALRPVAVFMMDLDGLKQINDRHGHLAGARTIAEVGRRLGAIVAEVGGAVSRFGGDEFSAFVPGLDRPQALELGERLRAAVAGRGVPYGDIVVQPTISVGLAVYPNDGAVPEALTRHADAALYRAKAEGRNRVAT